MSRPTRSERVGATRPKPGRRLVVVVTAITIFIGLFATPAAAALDFQFLSGENGFTPNGDGDQDTLDVRFCTSEVANVDIEVRNASGTIVRTLPTVSTALPYYCAMTTWDGREAGGAVLPDGEYSLRFRAANEAGSYDAEFRTAINTAVPGTLAGPAAGSTLGRHAEFVFTPAAGITASWFAVSGNFCRNSGDSFFDWSSQPDGTLEGQADTEWCADGPTTLDVSVNYSDTFGWGYSWQTSIDVIIDNPLRVDAEDEGRPSFFSPNGDGQEETIGGVFCVSRPATIDVVIRAEDGAVVKTLASDVSIPGRHYSPDASRDNGYRECDNPSYNVVWDGRDEAGNIVADGNYNFYLDAEDDNGNVAGETAAAMVDTRPPGVLTEPAAGAMLSGLTAFVFTPRDDLYSIEHVTVACLGEATQQPDGTWAGTGDASNCASGSTALDVTVGFYDYNDGFHLLTTPGPVVNVAAGPSATLEVSPSSGIAPAEVTATFTGTDSDSPALTYSLDFGDGSAPVTGTLPETPVDHTYTDAGIYTVRLEVSDGGQRSVHARAVSIGLAETLTAVAGDDQNAAVDDVVRFDGGASRPLVGIASYEWDFGDGNVATGAQVEHVYAAPGDKTVTLTVRAGSVVDTDTTVVHVAPAPASPGLEVTVTDASTPVAGADVVVVDADGVRTSATTAANGVGLVHGLADGAYTVYAWHDGYLAATAPAVVAGDAGNVAFAVERVSIEQTSSLARRLNAQEITDLGLDPDAAENQNVYEFDIHMAFVEGDTYRELEFNGYTTDGGFHGAAFAGPGGGPCSAPGCSADIGSYRVYPELRYVDDAPTVAWMVVPARAKWLKEFFDVRLMVSNLAPAGSTFRNGTVGLNALPAGVRLAPTAAPQGLVQTLPDVPGGESASASWVLRGDTEGRYTISGEYSGTLEPLGKAVRLSAATAANALRVWGSDAVEMVLDVDDRVVPGIPHVVRVGLRNVSDIPVYNPAVELLDAGSASSIAQPREIPSVATDVIQPGATFWTPEYRLLPQTRTLELDAAFAKKTAGVVDGASTTISHPAVPLADVGRPEHAMYGSALIIGWPASTAPDITGYEVYFTPNRGTPFGDVPVATTNAGTLIAAVPNAQPGYYAVTTVDAGGRRTMHHALEPAAFTAPPNSTGILPSVTIADASAREGNTGTSTNSVKVSLSWPSTQPVTVNYVTGDFNAVAPADYVSRPSTALTFAPGQTEKTVPFDLVGDTAPEGNEVFLFGLSNPVNATIGDNIAIMSILDDDGPPTVSVKDVKVTEGTGADKTATFTVTAAPAPGPGQTYKVNVATAPGVATSPADYTAVPTTTLTFTAGQTTKSVNVAVKGDSVREANETFALNLSTPVGVSLADASAAGVIVDNDGGSPGAPKPYVAVGDTRVVEGNTGTATVPVTVTLSYAATTTTSVNVSTADGTAVGGSDYNTLAPTAVTFAAGQTTKTVNVAVRGDVAREPHERFTVQLTSPTNLLVGDANATIVILDNEGPMSVSARDAFAFEGSHGTTTLPFLVRLAAPPVTGQTFTVSVSTSTAGSASTGTDYAALAPATVTFGPGETAKTVKVVVKGDVAPETNETVLLTLSSGTANVADATATGYIIDDD